MDENTKKMLAGKPYSPMSDELIRWQQQAHNLNQQYNLTKSEDVKKRAAIIDQLIPHHGKHVSFAGPIHFDFGRFTTIGEGTFANFNLTVLDSCPVTIGANCMLGPNLTLATAKHPLLADQRTPHVGPDSKIQMAAYAAPITIGDNVWFGANVTVLPGVTIGDNAVIGAGAVVSRDIPADSVAVGVPAKAIRKITEADRLSDWPY